MENTRAIFSSVSICRAVLCISLAVASCLSAGCREANRTKNKAGFSKFDDVYEALDAAGTAEKNQDDGKRYNAKFEGITLRQLSEYLATISGKTVVVEEKHLERTITLDVKEQPIEIIMHLAARQTGTGVLILGNAYIIGDVRPEDYGVMVRRVSGMNREDLSTLLAAVGSGQGRVYAGSDGLAVVADSIYSLMRMNEALDRVMVSDTATWVVQLYFLTETGHKERELTIGAEFEAGYKFAKASLTGKTSGTEYAFDSWLRAKGQSGEVGLEQAPLVLTAEGTKAVIHSGRNIPIPKKAVSDSGTVSTTEYEMVKDGLDLELLVRDGGQDMGVLELKLSMGQVEGYVEEAPITVERRIETTVRIKGGGVYLLGQLDGKGNTNDRTGFLSLGQKKKVEKNRVEVWARVHRIGGMKQ